MSNIQKKTNQKIVLKGMDRNELREWCISQNQTKFRAEQLYEWMYQHGKTEASQMTNLSKSFRDYLSEHVILATLQLEEDSASTTEETHKYLFRTEDDYFIETVSMVDDERHTVCISAQIGCSVDCSFCATASMGIIRNLKTGEIIDQLTFVRNNIKTPITNVVFMGMGEPFLNYERVLKAADIFHDQKGFGLGAYRITISTSGSLPKIHQYFEEKRKYKLAISLNSSNNETRTQIMPLNKKWPIEELVKVARENAQRHQKIMFEYVLLSGVNDSVTDALALASLLKGVDCKLNIIPYNETDGQYKRPTTTKIEEFLKILAENQKGFRILVRWSRGQDIEAGCGQLVVTQDGNG
jgi:23S rRNA (adenine2503-C2)-methyltransferase